jgi:hypothetical protein
MTRYRIYQLYADGSNEWTEISVQRFLKLTEGRGAYKKGTALDALKGVGQIRTDFSFFKITNPQSLPF